MADKNMKSLNFGGEDIYYPLPIVTSEDNDKILIVVDGEWAAGDVPIQSGAYVWTKQGMSETVTEATGVSYTLTTPNTTRPSSEIEYSSAAPVYNADKKTWEFADSIVVTLVNTDTVVPTATNVYVRLTSAPNVWYYATSFTAGALNTSGTCTKSMAYSTSYTAALDEAVVYVTDDDEAKYPDAGWLNGYYYERVMSTEGVTF